MQHTSLRWWKMRGRAQIPVYDSRTESYYREFRSSCLLWSLYILSLSLDLDPRLYIFIRLKRISLFRLLVFSFFFLWFSLKWKILNGKEKELIDRWVDFLKILKNGILLICIYLCFYEYLRGNVKTSSSSSFSSSKIHRVCIKSARGSKKTCFRDKQSNDPC